MKTKKIGLIDKIKKSGIDLPSQIAFFSIIGAIYFVRSHPELKQTDSFAQQAIDSYIYTATLFFCYRFFLNFDKNN